MPTRHALPWTEIIKDVLAAIDTYNQQRRFVNCWWVAKHIYENLQNYPIFAGLDETVCKSRVCVAGSKMGWVRYNRIHGKRSPVFIDPRVIG